METGAAGMGRGKDTVRRHLWRAVLQLMKPAHRTEFLTVPRPADQRLEWTADPDQGAPPRAEIFFRNVDDLKVILRIPPHSPLAILTRYQDKDQARVAQTCKGYDHGR